MSSFITATAISVRRSGRFHHYFHLQRWYHPVVCLSGSSCNRSLEAEVWTKQQEELADSGCSLQTCKPLTCAPCFITHDGILSRELNFRPFQWGQITARSFFYTVLSFPSNATRSSCSSQRNLILCIFWVFTLLWYCNSMIVNKKKSPTAVFRFITRYQRRYQSSEGCKSAKIANATIV